MSNHSCPLCESPHTEYYLQDSKRSYWQCQNCNLVFVDRYDLPSSSAEINEYRLHENHEEDEGYKTFLSRLATPLINILPPHQKGLDFGCGPTPLLAQILEDAGHQIALYDPFFQANKSVLNRKYDFISCTEAIEHFHHPYTELQLWNTLIKPQGWLAIMTKRVINKERFSHWHYKNDPTHVSFFSDDTFAFIAQHWGYKLNIVSSDVVLMQKRTARSQ